LGGAHYIHDNYVHDTRSVCIMLGESGGAGAGNEINYVWNNVIWNPLQSGAFYFDDTWSGAQNYVWNNTVASYPQIPFRVIYRASGGVVGVLSLINNHLIFGSANMLSIDAGASVAALTNLNNPNITSSAATTQGYTAANLFQPTSSAGSSVGVGQSLASVLNGSLLKDILGISRPQAQGWDAGAYQFSGGAPAPQAPNTPSNISPSGGATGVSLTPTLTASSYSDPQNSAQRSCQWTLKDATGATTLWDSGVQGPATSTAVPAAILNYGTTYTWQVRYANSLGLWSSYSTPTTLATVTAPPSPPPPAPAGSSIVFQAGDGTITAPFVLANGAISQAVNTVDPTQGGEATYAFSASVTGSYTVSALVNAPSDGANSFFVQIDGEPVSPTDVWDVVNMTSGFEWRTVSWRGDQGTFDNPQFSPKVWNLKVGPHALYIRGREANAFVQSISIEKIPGPPSNLRVASSQP
jgi:hypothetical protein